MCVCVCKLEQLVFLLAVFKTETMRACSTGNTCRVERCVFYFVWTDRVSGCVCVHNFVKQTRSEPRKLQPFHYLNRNSECVHTWQLEMCSWFPTVLDTGYVGTRVSVHFFPFLLELMDATITAMTKSLWTWVLAGEFCKRAVVGASVVKEMQSCRD